MKSLIFITIILFSFSSFSQNRLRGENRYSGVLDKNLTIKKISVLPFKDNVGGTYSKPLEEYTRQYIKDSHLWDYAKQKFTGQVPTPSRLEQNQNQIANLAQKKDTDALIIAEIVNTPKGINLKLDLFLTSDNKLLIQSQESKIKDFSLASVTKKYHKFLEDFLDKIPYDGLILSRTGNNVTLNLGSENNIRPGQVLSAAQIVSLNRHPKFNFIINSDKEILGQIKIKKVDRYLSFGEILNEKEKGSVQVNSKITGTHHVVYNTDTQDQSLTAGAPEGSIIYGKNPNAWRPSRTPTFGSVTAHLGVGTHNESFGNSNGSSKFSPSLSGEAEIWITKKWSLHAGLMQGITSAGDTDFTFTAFDLLVGHNFRFRRGLNGPHLEVLGGLANFKSRVGGTNSFGFRTIKYKGLKIGLLGSVPLETSPKWSIGGEAFAFINPSADESPDTGSKGDASATQFAGFAKYKMSSRLQFLGKLSWDQYSTSFASQNSSQKAVAASAGLRYLF